MKLLSIIDYEVANLEQTLCLDRLNIHLVLAMVCHRNISQLTLKRIVMSLGFNTMYYYQLHFRIFLFTFSSYIYRSCEKISGWPLTTALKMTDHRYVFTIYFVVIISCVLHVCISITLNIDRQKRNDEVI